MDSKRLQQNLKIIESAEERKEELDQLDPLLRMICNAKGIRLPIGEVRFVDKQVSIDGLGNVRVTFNTYWRYEIDDLITVSFPLNWLDQNTVPVERAYAISDNQERKRQIEEANEKIREEQDRRDWERLRAKFGALGDTDGAFKPLG